MSNLINAYASNQFLIKQSRALVLAKKAIKELKENFEKNKSFPIIIRREYMGKVREGLLATASVEDYIFTLIFYYEMESPRLEIVLQNNCYNNFQRVLYDDYYSGHPARCIDFLVLEICSYLKSSGFFSCSYKTKYSFEYLDKTRVGDIKNGLE